LAGIRRRSKSPERWRQLRFYLAVSPVDDALAADKWRSRIAGYRAEGLTNVLVTTDDLGGVRHDRLLKVIEDIVQGTLAGDPDASFQTTITLYRYHGGHPVSTSRAEAV
jgi:hypothetical protein